MAQLRFVETTSDWVIFAPTRVRPRELRSHAAPAEESADATKSCPFCPGNEAWTPPDLCRASAGRGTQ
jgi:galactose-1-phosphate uridylyltransferase